MVLYIAIAIVALFLLGAAVAAKKQASEKETARRMKEEQEKKLQELQKKREEEKAQRDAQRKAWDDLHGRIVVPVSGVTFDNEDGTSRQKILKDLKVSGGDAYLNLEEYEYKGSPAIRITVNDMCIGNVPKSRVAEVSSIMDRLENGRVDIEKFTPEDEDDDGHRRGSSTIYRADLVLVYSKTTPTVGTERNA